MTVKVYKDPAVTFEIVDGPPPEDQSALVAQLNAQLAALTQVNQDLLVKVQNLEALVKSVKQTTIDFSKNQILPIPKDTQFINVWIGGSDLGIAPAPNGVGPASFPVPTKFLDGKVYGYSGYALNSSGGSLGYKLFSGSFRYVP